MKLTHLSNWPRPRYKLFTLAVYLVCFFGFFIAAHESGSGFVQVIGSLLLAIFLTNAFMAFYQLQRVQLRITSAPYDGMTNQIVTVEVVSTKNIQLTFDSRGKSKISIPRNQKTQLTFRPGHYGIIRHIEFMAFSSYPFGIIPFYKRINCPLPAPIHIAPTMVKAKGDITTGDRLQEQRGVTLTKSNLGDLKSLSPYIAGDSFSSISWAKSAHSQQLLVRNHEQPENYMSCHLIIDPPLDRLQADTYLGEKLFLIVELLKKNYELTVQICDVERGIRESKVSGELEAKRLMARAIAMTSSA